MRCGRAVGGRKRPGFGRGIPCEFSALCFSLSCKILITSFPYWALLVKHMKRTPSRDCGEHQVLPLL